MKATAKNQGNIKRMLQVLAMSMLIVAFTGCKGTTDSGPKDDIAFKDNTTITCYGTIVYLENPCITIPCIPGIIYGINTGNDFAIISYKNKVFSSDTPLNINNMFFFQE